MVGCRRGVIRSLANYRVPYERKPWYPGEPCLISQACQPVTPLQRGHNGKWTVVGAAKNPVTGHG
jgi:hypothetical protein